MLFVALLAPPASQSSVDAGEVNRVERSQCHVISQDQVKKKSYKVIESQSDWVTEKQLFKRKKKKSEFMQPSYKVREE